MMCFSQNTCIIRGSAPAGEINYVAIRGYKDLVSLAETTLAHTTLDKNHHFKLTVPLESTIYARLQFGFEYADIYLEAGKEYDVIIHSDGEYTPGGIYDKQSLNYSFVDHSPENVNLYLQSFNQLYNNFIVENFDEIYRGNQSNLLDSIQKDASKFLHAKNKYVKDYATYRLASLEQIGHRKSKKTIFNDYFKGKEILYNNIEYMSLFNEFYEQYLGSGGYSKKMSEIKNVINHTSSLADLSQVLSNDPLIEKGEFEQLVILKSLSELYYNPNYNQSNVKKMINTLAESGQSKEIRIIANDILTVYRKLTPGSPAPEFTLKDTDGNVKSLEDYRGSYLLINFWKNDCNACEVQMKYLNDILKRFPNKLKVISISSSPHMGFDKSMKLKYHFPWEFFNFDNQYDLLSKYEIKFYPTFVLISPEGKIIKYPAPFPDENLGNYLEKVIFNKK